MVALDLLGRYIRNTISQRSSKDHAWKDQDMSKRILLVEDNPINQELAYDLLTAVGFEVLCAADAEEGIRIARDSMPELILMDLVLPGRDGLSATQELKSDPRTRHIPIIALTAQAMPEDREKALSVGCDGYMTKPINPKELDEALNNFKPRAPVVPSASGATSA